MADYRSAPTIEAMLRTIAAHAKAAVGRCDSAGVTLVDAGQVTGRGCSDGVAQDLDAVQLDNREGPCVDALRFLQIFNVASMVDGEEWPAFRQLAATLGITSSLSVPLCRGGRALGAINLYSRVRNGFKDCEHLATTLASEAAALLGAAAARTP